MRTLRACDHVVASTPALADELVRHVGGRSFVVNNAIDAGMDAVAQSIDSERAEGRWTAAEPGSVTVTYGSGSLAHDRDFAVAAPALARLMRDRADVRLRLVGTVRVPAELRPLRDRISRLPTMSYGGYLREQARADISIAPLEAVEFNRYKSQVKYLEAGLLGRAFVASPTVYSDYVRAGETGLIATSPDDWYEHLRALADDETLRTRLGTAAREHVRTWSVPVTAPLEYRQLATDWPGV